MNDPSYITIHYLCLYLSFVDQILSLFHQLLQHCCEGYSADMTQMNTQEGSYAYDITLLTANVAAAF